MLIMGSIGIFVGALISANIYGELAVLEAQMNQKNYDFQEKIRNLATCGRNWHLPSE